MAGAPGLNDRSAAEATTGASVMRGGAWNFVSRLLPQLYVLIVSVVAARFLGPDGMGRQSFIAFVSLTVTTLFSGGLGVSLMRYTGELFGREQPDVAAGLIGWAWRITAVCAAVGAGILVIVAASGATPQAAWLFAAVATAFAILHRVPSAALVGAQRWRDSTIVGLIAGTLAVPATIVVLALGGGITGMFVIEAVMAIATLVFTQRLARRAYRQFGSRPAMDRDVRTETARYALWSTVGVVLTLIVFRRSEFFFLDRFSSDTEIAIYSIAFAATFATSQIPETLAQALFPAFATLFGAGATDRLRSGFGRATRLLTVATLPVTAGMVALGPEALVLVYGNDYSGTEPVLRLMALGLPLLMLLNVSNALLVALGLIRPMILVGAVGAALNVALAVILIPRYDAVGAALANTGSQTAVAIGLLWYASRLVGKMPVDWPMTLRTLAAVTPAGFVAWLVAEALPAGAGLPLGLVAGGAVFAAAARLIGILSRDDADWLRRHTRGGRVGRSVDVVAGWLSRRAPRADGGGGGSHG
jgi:O-antigen/teichoic acid export membrane protein